MASTRPLPTGRQRPDRCPGVLRPWVAEDGALLRIRLVGGVLLPGQLAGLADLATRYGDGTIKLTARANVQVRGFPLPVPDAVVARTTEMGLLPSATHERVRNIMVSPFTGRLGGVADLRPVARGLDAALCAEAALASLPARFLFCLDDRGDLRQRTADLAAVAVDADRARLWAGGMAGEVVELADVPRRLVALARAFLGLRGTGASAPWHVAELPGGGADLGGFAPPEGQPPETGTDTRVPPHGWLVQDDGRRVRHLAVPQGMLTRDLAETALAAAADEVVVTPWRSLVLPDLDEAS